jgi:peroxiredoxin
MKQERNRYGVAGALMGDLFRDGRVSRSRQSSSFLFALMALCVCVSLAACATVEEPQLAEMERGDFTPVIDDIEMLRVGDKAPLFEVSDVFGNSFNLGDKIGKNVIVLVFWSVYCDPCRSSMPAYSEVYRRHREKGLELFTINMDGEEMTDAIRGFLDGENIGLPVLLDEPEGDFLKIADPYGVQGTPTIYIIDKKGRIAFGKVGTISIETLSSLVEDELAKQ